MGVVHVTYISRIAPPDCQIPAILACRSSWLHSYVAHTVQILSCTAWPISQLVEVSRISPRWITDQVIRSLNVHLTPTLPLWISIILFPFCVLKKRVKQSCNKEQMRECNLTDKYKAVASWITLKLWNRAWTTAALLSHFWLQPQEAKQQAITLPVFSFKFSLLLYLEIHISSQNLPKLLETLPIQAASMGKKFQASD